MLESNWVAPLPSLGKVQLLAERQVAQLEVGSSLGVLHRHLPVLQPRSRVLVSTQLGNPAWWPYWGVGNGKRPLLEAVQALFVAYTATGSGGLGLPLDTVPAPVILVVVKPYVA